MKKFLTLTIAIFAFWAISTFIIGNQTQKEVENYIVKSNKLYATSGIALKLLDYNKSFLHSTAQIELNVIDPAVVKLLEKDYQFPLTMNYNIEHGPLFFENGIGIGLAKIKHHLLLSSIFKEKSKKRFLELIEDDINLQTDIVICFSKEVNYKLLSDEIKFKIEDKSFLMTPLTMRGTSNLENFQGMALMEIEHLQAKEENSSNIFEMKDIRLDVDIKEFLENSLVFGDFGLSIKNLIIKDNSNPTLSNIDVAVHGTMKNERMSESIMKSIFEGDVDFKNSLLPDEFKSLKTVYLKMDLENLGIQGMLEFQKSAQTMQKKQSKLLAEMQTTKQEEMATIFAQFKTIQDEMMNQIIHSFNALLIKDKTTITYLFDVETKDEKRSKAMAKVGYTGDIEFKGTVDEIMKKAQKEILSLISLNLDINLDKNHLKFLPNSELQIKMAVMQGFVRENNNSYSVNAFYKNKELMVNDKNLTSTILPLLMMATQMGVQ